nr:hypothetical protein [Saprospiraceae bacterium]
MKKLLILPLLFFFASHLSAQVRGFCGTTENLDPMIERLLNNKRTVELLGPNFGNRNVVSFVPIRFHLVANASGSGRIAEKKVYELLCKLNEEYADQNIQFYIKDSFTQPNNDVLYNTPKLYTNFGILKDSKAINIFICNTAGDGNNSEGVTLGYYSPFGDYLVIKKSEVNSTSTTTPHEVGHFFSLAHPFNGWDCAYYNEADYGQQITFTNAPCPTSTGNVLVELVNGSNCNNSGDYVCDTPADYGMGFGWSTCDYNGPCMDINGDLVRPEEQNHMSYFLNCSEYFFSPEQKSLIWADYQSPQRNNLRSNALSGFSTITDAPTITFPENNAVLNYYNSVSLSWNPVAGADRYYLEIALDQAFSATFYTGVV